MSKKASQQHQQDAVDAKRDASFWRRTAKTRTDPAQAAADRKHADRRAADAKAAAQRARNARGSN